MRLSLPPCLPARRTGGALVSRSVEDSGATEIPGEAEYLDALSAIHTAVQAMAMLRTNLTGSGAETARAISLAITQVECGELWLKKGWEQK